MDSKKKRLTNKRTNMLRMLLAQIDALKFSNFEFIFFAQHFRISKFEFQLKSDFLLEIFAPSLLRCLPFNFRMCECVLSAFVSITLYSFSHIQSVHIANTTNFLNKLKWMSHGKVADEVTSPTSRNGLANEF